MKQTYKITKRSEEKDSAGNSTWTIEAVPVDAEGKPVAIGTFGKIWQPPIGKPLQYSPTNPADAAAAVIGSTVTLEIA